MDLYNIMMKIPYALLLLTGFTIITTIYIGGLQSITLDIDTYNQERFRAAVVLENTLSASEDQGEISYDYKHRRATLPAEFFREKASSNDEIGYMKENGHCYIPRVNGLNGEDFAFNIQPYDSAGNHKLDCVGGTSQKQAVYSPVMVIRKGYNKERVPARLIVYAK